MSELPFTGERFTPECVREIWYEHFHRYAFARALVAGKRVADVACGEGYGAHLLAQSAQAVTGLDLSADSIAHAQRRYAAQTNLSFEQGDACALSWADASFDVLTSFETLEHLEDQEALMAGFARVLGERGVLMVSSPDKRNYSDLRDYHNEFHVRELYRDEFETLLKKHFKCVRVYAQKLLFQSALWIDDAQNLSTSVRGARWHTVQPTGEISDGPGYGPMYYIAVCTQSEADMPELPEVDLFGDLDESVYRHYEQEIRKNMQAGGLLQQASADLHAEQQAHAATRLQLIEANQALAESLSALAAPRGWRRWFSRTE